MKRSAFSAFEIPAKKEGSNGPVWAAQLFLLSLVLPFRFTVGSLLLMPHRIMILVLFIPLLSQLFFKRKAGKILAADFLLLGSAIWAGVSLVVNHPLNMAIEPFGIHLIEFFGGYLIARVAIRSAQDLMRVVQTLFAIILVLAPFAAAESITRQPVLLQLLPWTSVEIVYADLRFGMRRAQTVFAHPILFGVFISSGLGLFWYSLRPTWTRLPSAIVVALSTLFSLSTGALLSLVTQIIFIVWETVMKKIRDRWTIFAVGSVIGYLLVDIFSNRTPFHVLVTYASFNSTSAYNRILIWQYGTENVWDNPFFGLGLNDWVRPAFMSTSVDNFWLLLTMQYGLPAILMIGIAIFMIVRKVGRVTIQARIDGLCRSGYLVSIGGVIVAGGTVHYWQTMMAFVMFIFGSGLWLVTGGASDTDTVAPQPVNGRGWSPYTRQPAPGSAVTSGRPQPKSRARRRAELPHKD